MQAPACEALTCSLGFTTPWASFAGTTRSVASLLYANKSSLTLLLHKLLDFAFLILGVRGAVAMQKLLLLP